MSRRSWVRGPPAAELALCHSTTAALPPPFRCAFARRDHPPPPRWCGRRKRRAVERSNAPLGAGACARTRPSLLLRSVHPSRPLSSPARNELCARARRARHKRATRAPVLLQTLPPALQLHLVRNM
eukprot:scaffold5295_cov390-Prasinococcus_capsulatus_cf.AAC.6